MPKVVDSAVPVSSRTGWEMLYSLITLNKEGTLIGLWLLFLVLQLGGIFGWETPETREGLFPVAC